MKKFYAALGIVAVVAIFAYAIRCRPPQPCTERWVYTLCIKGRGTDEFFQHPHFTDFNRKACDLKNADGDTKLRYKANNNAAPVDYDPCSPPPAVETKVTKAEGADRAAAGASAANDPSVTYRVRTSDLEKLNAVLDTFK